MGKWTETEITRLFNGGAHFVSAAMSFHICPPR